MRSLLCFLLFSSALLASPRELAEARRLYGETDFAAALKILEKIPDKDAETWTLIGRSHYLGADYKKATDALEKALAIDPANSEICLWLGRAYGRRAETSSFVTAPGFASKARQHFEKAVELDGGNKEALNDLFEYYLEAPGFLGGGFDKATALAARIEKIDPIEAHYARYRLAMKRKEFGNAEQQLRRAAEMAPTQVGRILDLGRFLARQGRHNEADQAFQQAQRIAPNEPKVLFAMADTYIKANRNLEAARELLKRYLSSKLSPDDPPRAEAQKLLRQAGG